MKFGYARVSTTNQDYEIQLESLKAYGCERIYDEKISGKTNEREQLQALLLSLREGDIVVVYKLDRLARSLKGMLEIVETINKRGAGLVSLNAGDMCDTTTAMGRAFLQIAGVFAELERSMIEERTSKGREAARARGVVFGKPRGSSNKATAAKLERIKIYLKAGQSWTWIGKEVKCSQTLVSRAAKELKEIEE